MHYKTGEPIPQALVDKIKKASSLNEGYKLTEAIAAASLDMQWHQLSADTTITDADAFEKAALHTTGFDLPQVPPRCRSSYFLHIWSNGYGQKCWKKMLIRGFRKIQCRQVTLYGFFNSLTQCVFGQLPLNAVIKPLIISSAPAAT